MSELPKISELTPEQMRGICAEANGWSSEGGMWLLPSCKAMKCFASSWVEFELLPKYDESRDAMATVLETLKDDFIAQNFEIARYINHLEDQVAYRATIVGWSFALATASPLDQLAAFLLTKQLARR